MKISEQILSIFRGRQKVATDRNIRNFISIELSGHIPEETIQPPIPLIKTEKQLTLWEIQRLFLYVGESALSGAVITIKNISAGLAIADELRRSISMLRQSGKKVYVHLESPGNIEYFIASSADHISINPMTALNFTGLSSEAFFLRNLLDKTGIEAEFIGAGEYKSAAEVLTREAMSEKHREMLESIIDQQYSGIINEVSRGRDIEAEKLSELIDSAPFTATQALETGLADRVCYESDIKGIIEEGESSGINLIPQGKILRIIKYKTAVSRWLPFAGNSPGYVALVSIDGMITQGRSRPAGGGGIKTAGSDTVINTLDRIDSDRTVKGVLIRVSSPGGSAVASDLIRERIEKLSQNKPVYISMCDIAASGGYMVSLSGSRIFCGKFTLTGSIGVVAGKINISGMLKNFGINSELVKRGEMSSIYSLTKGFTDKEKEKFTELIDCVYSGFVDLVSHSRGLESDKVEKVSKGRVWTGSQAIDNELVDEEGGLKEALQSISERIGITGDVINNVRVFSHESRISLQSVHRIFGYQDLRFLIEPLGREYLFTVMPWWIRFK